MTNVFQRQHAEADAPRQILTSGWTVGTEADSANILLSVWCGDLLPFALRQHVAQVDL